MFKILQKLEDPKRPLMGPTYFELELAGLFLPKKKITRYIYIFLHVILMIFVVTEFIEMWFLRYNLILLFNNIKVSMLSAISATKVLTFFKWQKYWRQLIDYATKVDLSYRRTACPEMKVIIDKYTLYARRFTYFYFILVSTTCVIVCTQPFVKYFSIPSYRENVRNGIEPYAEVVSSWVPFDKTKLWGYLAVSAYQIFGSVHAVGWITSYDTNSIVLMVFFGGQLDLLRCRCARIFGTEDEMVTDEEAKKRLIQCHIEHVELIR